MSVETIEKDLKLGKLNSIYLLYGEETFLLESCLKKIKNNFGELVNGINFIKIDESNIENIISDISTPAFGYEKKLIIARDTGIFKKEAKKKESKNTIIQKKISDYIKENIEMIQEATVLVFVEKEADKVELYKTIESYGEVCNFEKLKPVQIAKRLKAICNAYKVNVDESTIMYLIEICGTSMQDLINEIRKLIEYAGENGTINKQDVDKLAIKQIDSVIFDLTDSLGKKDIPSAMETLKGLIYNKEPIQKILITLYNHFKKLYLLKLAEKYNRNLAESMKLKPNQMFLVNKYKRQADYFKEEELRKIIEELIDLDSNYKIGLIDINIGLEAILCKYCSN